MKTKIAKVPVDWHIQRQKAAKKLGISTPESIIFFDKVAAQVIKKATRKGVKYEITIK